MLLCEKRRGRNKKHIMKPSHSDGCPRHLQHPTTNVRRSVSSSSAVASIEHSQKCGASTRMFQGHELLHVGVSVVNTLLHVTMVDLVTSVFCDDDLRALPSVPCLCHGTCCLVRTRTSRVTDNSKQVDPNMTAVNNKHKECATIPHFERQPHLDGSLFFSWRIQHTQQGVPSTRDT